MVKMSNVLNDNIDDTIYKKVKMMPKDEQKRLKIVKDIFEITKETKQILESQFYSEDNISEIVKEIRDTIE